MSTLTRRALSLDSKIAQCRHRIERGALRAERAGVLARLGHLGEAGREVGALKKEFGGHPVPEISVSLFLAEAWLAYFQDLSPHARDRVRRAQRLAEAAGLAPQQALSEAWLAHFAYVQLDLESMAHHVQQALSLAAPNDHAVRGRASLVLAEAFHLAQRMDLAQPWYALARRHAQAEGDAVTLSALIHNMAWHRALHALHAALWGGDGIAEARHALTSASATIQFDRARGVTALPALIQVAMALAHSVLGDAAKAWALYEAHAPQADAQGLRPLRALVLADMAWCCERLGERGQALHYAQAASKAFRYSHHADDRALAHARLAQLYRHWGEARKGSRHHLQARQRWVEHQALQARVLAVLAPWAGAEPMPAPH